MTENLRYFHLSLAAHLTFCTIFLRLIFVANQQMRKMKVLSNNKFCVSITVLSLSVRVTSVPLKVLLVDGQELVRHLSPSQTQVQLADTGSLSGIKVLKRPQWSMVLLQVFLLLQRQFKLHFLSNKCNSSREHRYSGVINTTMDIIWSRQSTQLLLNNKA